MPISLSICLFIHRSVSLSWAHIILLSFCFCSSVRPFLYLPVCAWPSFQLFVLFSSHQSIYLSLHLSWCLFLCPFVCPSIDPLSTALFICLMIHRFVCLSFHLLLIVCQFVWAILPFSHRSVFFLIFIRQFICIYLTSQCPYIFQFDWTAFLITTENVCCTFIVM